MGPEHFLYNPQLIKKKIAIAVKNNFLLIMDKVQQLIIKMGGCSIKMSQCGSNNCGEMFPQKVTGCNFCVYQTKGPCHLLHFSEPHPPAPPHSI